jgi:hypothetical protein
MGCLCAGFERDAADEESDLQAALAESMREADLSVSSAMDSMEEEGAAGSGDASTAAVSVSHQKQNPWSAQLKNLTAQLKRTPRIAAVLLSRKRRRRPRHPSGRGALPTTSSAMYSGWRCARLASDWCRRCTN